MMSLPLISVIVPVYNTENYISRCIDSILVQTYKNFELILVDDGCTDGSGTICDAYAKSDVRVRVIHKKNGGVTAARADGVKISKGEWITFVDADDTLTDDALNILSNNICADYDIIRGGYNVIGSKQDFYYTNNVLSCTDYRREVICFNRISPGPWASLVRKTLFTKEVLNIPRSIVFGEDLIMNIRLAFENSKAVKFIEGPVYNYIQNPGSCVYTFELDYNYIRTWYGYVQKSIAQIEQKEFVYELVILRLKFLRVLHKYYIKNNIWKKDAYHKELLNDIKENRNKVELSMVDKITILFSNPINSFIYFIMHKIFRPF